MPYTELRGFFFQCEKSILARSGNRPTSYSAKITIQSATNLYYTCLEFISQFGCRLRASFGRPIMRYMCCEEMSTNILRSDAAHPLLIQSSYFFVFSFLLTEPNQRLKAKSLLERFINRSRTALLCPVKWLLPTLRLSANVDNVEITNCRHTVLRMANLCRLSSSEARCQTMPSRHKRQRRPKSVKCSAMLRGAWRRLPCSLVVLICQLFRWNAIFFVQHADHIAYS